MLKGWNQSLSACERFFFRLNKKDGPIHPVHGKCWVLNRADGKGISRGRFSRQAYEAQVGPIPEGLQVLHKCDNPACVRAEHLFIGTISDNVRDAVNKGRKPGFPGNKHALGHKQSDTAKKTKSIKSKAYWEARKKTGNGGFKLSSKQVKEIRSRYVKTSYLVTNCKQLAEEYRVGRGQILKIVNGSQRKECS